MPVRASVVNGIVPHGAGFLSAVRMSKLVTQLMEALQRRDNLRKVGCPAACCDRTFKDLQFLIVRHMAKHFISEDIHALLEGYAKPCYY
jgi:hypothetical protein